MQGNDFPFSQRPVTVRIDDTHTAEYDSLSHAVSARMTPIELIEVLAERYDVDRHTLANRFTIWISEQKFGERETGKNIRP